MWDKILSHPMTILAMIYAGCVLTAIWMAITQRKALDDLRQKPVANRARLTLSGVASHS